MPYELIGDDDDMNGSIGYDLIGEEFEDLIGDDDEESFLEALAISGAGNSEIIGAAQRKAKGKIMLKKAAQQIAMRNSGLVVNTDLNRKRRYPLGFVPTDIAAGAALQIPASPQNLYRPERLVIPSDIAFDCGVRDVKIGNTSQFVQATEVPGALFSEVAINTGVTFDTAEVGNQVSVDIRNKSTALFQFSAGLVGTIAK